MPRMLRFHAPGALAHVMARGIDGKAVFGDDHDCEEFLKRLSCSLHHVGFRCLAWCLMPNHYHLVCRTNESPLSKLMRPLNAGYARWYNRRFGSTESRAIGEYLRFLAEGLAQSSPSDAGSLDKTASFEVLGSQKGWPAIIGDPEFVRRAMQNHEVGVRRRHRQADYGQVLRNLVDEVCSAYAISPDDLYSRGRENTRSRARIEFCRRAHLAERLPYAVIARHLGVTLSAVPNMLARETPRKR